MSTDVATTPTTAGETPFDQSKLEAFLGKLVGDAAGAHTMAMCALGDRLGLFGTLAAAGPATSAELAARAGVDERYAREWLSALACAGYLEYDPPGARFTLPPEHAAALAQEGGPACLGGAIQTIPALYSVLDRVTEAFRRGGGVPLSAYPAAVWDGIERLTASFFYNHQLVQAWLPALPDLQARLERGATVADVGCGRGRALIALAQAFPNSRFVGYDAFGPTIARATANAEAAGVADRVRFVHRDGAAGLLDAYDLITTFDVVHDAARPLDLLRAIRQALKPDGIYLCVEIASAERLEDNAGPVGALNYSNSLLFCMTQSLAQGGPGLGSCGLPEPKLRDLCQQAGFGAVRLVPQANPFNNFYAVTP